MTSPDIVPASEHGPKPHPRMQDLDFFLGSWVAVDEETATRSRA